jgi:iron complex outermembrane receptor protein
MILNMKGVLGLVFTFLTLYVVAQPRQTITLSGKISDANTGLPLSGATVYLTDARLGSSANREGVYTLRNVPSGHHLLEISFAGYTTIVEHIDITSNLEKNFTLAPAVVENQGVTVTGVTSATSTRKAPIPVTLIRKTQLMENASTNIIDALTKQPGISQISTGPAIAKPVIRGLGYNRVVIVNDGMRQEGQQWGDEHGIEIDEASVNRVEIIKGPASLIYGSDALAGVINFITNVPVAEGTVKGNVYSSYQSNNNQVGLNANIAGNQKGFNWNAYGSYKTAKDYRNKYDGRVLNSRFNERNFGGYVGLNKSWGFSHLVVSSFNQNVGLIEGDRDDATGQFLVNAGSALERIATKEDLNSRDLLIPNQNVQHYKIMSDNSFRLGGSRLKLNLGFQNNLRKEFGNAEAADETELFFDLKTVTYNAQWRLPEITNWETTIGASGMGQNNKNKGEEAIIPDYDLFDIGGFLFTQRDVQKTTISAGLRYDHRSLTGEEMMEDADIKFGAFKKSFSNVTGSVGISYHPSDKVNVKANIARGFRAPTLSELAANGAHEGTNRYEYGDRNLKSERSLQGDIGVDLDFTHVSFSANVFYNRLNDFIFYRRLSNALGQDSIVSVDGEDLEAFTYSQQDAKLYGAELVVDLHPHPLDWLHFENTVSLLRGRFDNELAGSNNLPMIPANRWISELRAQFSKGYKALHNFYFRIELEKTFKQDNPFTGYNTETATNGYGLLNAGIGTDVSINSRTAFSLHFTANNITDKAYQNHLNRVKYTAINNATGRMGVFNMGRNFSIKLNVPFNL